ncbi:MAG: AsmA family protein, partial [Steroidobacteraceae bacterium]
MRIGKTLSFGIAGLIALLVAALVAVGLLINPNDYKPRIAAAVKEATGRDLVLAGDLKLSVFPWIALEAGQASLGNPPGFGGAPFLTLRRAALRVRLLPLLGGRLVVGRVEIEGLDLELVKNAAGQGNWEGFGRAPTPAPARGRGNPGETLQGIAGIQITDARVRYQAITLQHIKIETGSFAQHGEVPVTLHADADRGVAGEQASVDARFDLRADSGARRYTLSALNVNSEIALAGHVRAEPLSVSAPRVDLDLAAQTLAAAAVAVNFAGAQVGVSLQGTHVLDAPALTATVTVAPLVVRETLARLGIPVPAMRDPKALSLAAVAGSIAYGGDIARVDHLEATVDDTHTTGSAEVNLTTHAIAFDLSVDTVDLDR